MSQSSPSILFLFWPKINFWPFLQVIFYIV